MTLDEVEILVISDSYWGRGATFAIALQKASNPKKYQVFICHKDTRMDGMGLVTYPKEHTPREIFRKGFRKKEKGYVDFERQAEEDKVTVHLDRVPT